METTESTSMVEYGKPPWVFKGSALYQLHLVKSETARAFIPKEFRIVEAFGYTLGGFFFANYEDSPAGTFDELVVIAGTVWNPPTSCAWAARVLVSSDKACIHGRQDVGLPSQVANFAKIKRLASLPTRKKNRFHDFLHNFGITGSPGGPGNTTDINVKEISCRIPMDICSINLNSAPEENSRKWMGPSIKMSLPSFSGRTEYSPNLLKYSCQIECRLRVVAPLKVSGPAVLRDDATAGNQGLGIELQNEDPNNYKRNLSISVMLSKPVLALEFNCLEMKVEAPIVLPQS